jgi:hypothetical protein
VIVLWIVIGVAAGMIVVERFWPAVEWPSVRGW